MTCSPARPYSRRFEKVWASQPDLRVACVLGHAGADAAFVRAVLRGKTKTRCEHEVRRLLAARLRGYDLIRLIGEIPLFRTASQSPLID